MIYANVMCPNEDSNPIELSTSGMVKVDPSELEELQSVYRDCYRNIGVAMSLADGCTEDRNSALSILAAVRRDLDREDKILTEMEKKKG